MKRIAIIGAGSWGTALAIVAARASHEVTLWSRNLDVVNSINERRFNPFYLTAVEIPGTVVCASEIDAVVNHAEHVLFAAPSHAARELFTAIARHLNELAVVVSVAKGIEIETGKRISEIFKEVGGNTNPFVCLSGPSFAREVVAGHPTANVAASKDRSEEQRLNSSHVSESRMPSS